jgi:predicted nucleotidyltransferase
MGIVIPIMGTGNRPRRGAAVGLADALFGHVRQRVLGLLFSQSDRGFYANEIIRLVGAGTGAVQRELARLEAAGLVTVNRVGRQKHYHANPGAPIFRELRGIVLKTSGLADVLRVALAPLKDAIRAAFVFGSVAEGTHRAESDIDLMVISDRVTYAELYGALETASAQLSRAVNPTVYTPDEFRRRVRQANPFVTKVRERPKLWIIGDGDALPT